MSNVGVDSYTLRMVDQITAPLRKVEEQVAKLTEAMDKLTGTVAGGSGLQAVFGSLSGYARVAEVAFKALYGVMEATVVMAGKVAVGFGKAVLAATQFRTQNIQAMDIFFGHGKGEGMFKKSLAIGGITPQSELEVVKQVRELGAAGFKGNALSQANAGLLDVQALIGGQESGLLREYFGKFIGSSKVEADDLRRSAQLSGFDGGEVGLKARLIRNATGKDATGDVSAQYASLMKAGKINGRDVIAAILQGINERLDAGQGLGSAAKKMGEGTLEGLVSNLEAAPMRFLAEMQLEKLPGIKSLMEFLKRLLTFFDHGTDQGKRLSKVIEEMTNTLFGGLDKITEKDLGRFFESGLKVAEQLKNTIGAAWDILDQMLHGDTSAFVKAFGTGLLEVGKLIGKGIWEGIWATGGAQDGKAALPAGFAAELAGRALRANDLGSVYKAANAVEGGFAGVVEELSGRTDLPPELAEQVATAREKLGLDKSGSGPSLADTVAEIQNQGDTTVIVNVNDVATSDHGHEIGKAVQQALRRSKVRTGAKK